MAFPPGVSAVKVKRGSDKQRRLGPAPFASFEDLSDDLESPEEKPALPTPLPDIQEDVRMAADGTLMSPESTASSSVVCGGTGSLQTPSTPRIDISRASSSSHQDSNNSSPERELFAGTGESGEITKLGLGFKEEGAADLRSSTEELDYHGEPKEKPAIKKLLKHELEAQSEKESQERKDSACSAISDVGLLSISGRTSRLSSVGSAASGGSVTSHVSHLSVVSGLSRASSGRSTSPHKMLLETSFCGNSELDYTRTNKEALKKQEGNQGEIEDHERKRLVLQDSFEDELPYVPTTLPLERSVAVPIVPIKQRISEVRTCPIERPRSTTPINPSLLEDYVHCKSVAEDVDQTIDKIRINLPREDSINRGKNSRKASGTAKSWLEFAEHGLNSPREYRRSSPTSPPPPPLPPRAQPIPPPPITPPPKPTSWINFEEIPEKRKPPKRIQTIPSRGTVDLPEASKVQSESSKTVVYSYVNPEDCKCECHETTSKLTGTHKVGRGQCSHKEGHQHSSNR
uniref:Uncharacterized protein n=1 Tax=Timema tahoe TaxID=61484 RepID=A0A7R9IRZ5_9NEOP|nr:unnamed protein product [Timema tahoe]